ncbi:MAG: DUF4419 domain-containing protein [Fibrobacter sp.]|nr:DUF4419 domain-containing protein [Fibrobacter sp.]
MIRFILLLVFAIGFSTAAADAIVKDKDVKDSTPQYTMTHDIGLGNKQVLLDERTGKEFIKELKGSGKRKLPHPFVGMLGVAFANHHSIEIYPDDIWLMLMDGIRQHVKHNRDALKDKFVRDGADTNIVIIDNSLTPQSPPSAWKKDITQIYDTLYKKLPEATRTAFEVDFSTSTAIDKFVTKTMVMSISSEYYTYTIMTLCGIPQIFIKGNKQDWQKLKDSFDKLASILDMTWWAEQIDPILNEFILTFDKKFNMEFWRGIYKYIPPGHGSGTVPHINGWITKFFPYIDKIGQERMMMEQMPKEFIESLDDKMKEKVKKTLAEAKQPLKHRTDWDKPLEYKDFTIGKNDIPVKWKYLGKEIPLQLSTGFWGVTIDPKTKHLKTIRGYILTR